MSIIYDALNKTQEIRDNQPNNSFPLHHHRRVSIIIILFCLGFILIFSSLFGMYFYYKNTMLAQKSLTVSLKQSARHYLLSGIFLSDRNQVAIINHAYYHIGDQLDDMKITSMSVNEVKLKNKDNKTLTLSMLS